MGKGLHQAGEPYDGKLSRTKEGRLGHCLTLTYKKYIFYPPRIPPLAPF